MVPVGLACMTRFISPGGLCHCRIYLQDLTRLYMRICSESGMTTSQRLLTRPEVCPEYTMPTLTFIQLQVSQTVHSGPTHGANVRE